MGVRISKFVLCVRKEYFSVVLDNGWWNYSLYYSILISCSKI